MLTQLTITNFGLIDKLSIEFSDKLTILTGETGAGKSIIIDALRYALGERFDTAFVRDKSAACTVEAVFQLSDVERKSCELFEEYLSADDPTFIVNRSYLPDGKTKIRINGKAVTVAQLKELGDHLIDFHGPNDHQLLLDQRTHIGMLDRLCDIETECGKYDGIFASYVEVCGRLERIEESAATRDRDLELANRQVRELETIKLDTVSYETIRDKRKRLANAQRLYERASELVSILANDESGAGEKIATAFGPMKALTALDSSASDLAERLSRVQEEHAELLNRLERYRDDLSFEQEESAQIERQADAYDAILRAYGPTIEDAAAFYRTAKERLAFLADLTHNDSEAKKELARVEKDLAAAADKLTKKRIKGGERLRETIEKELKDLGIMKVRFEARVEKVEYHRRGRDDVTFYISPNAGEAMKPLAAIVSSGEASRVMLALKKALIAVDPIPTLIFDEIDAQIGGRLGTVTGSKVRELADHRQVILITHLPQIASFADSHYKITKAVEKGRAITRISELDAAERVQELAQMMSGEDQTAIAVAHAKEMLSKAKKT